MTFGLLFLVIALLLVINVVLWKSGFLYQAENPTPVLDVPVKNPKEQKAFLKRLHRWKDEGKVTREDFERFSELAEREWDVAEKN